MRNVTLEPESFFSWRTLNNDVLDDLPAEPHVLIFNRTSWIQLILIEILDQGILMLGFWVISDIFQECATGDIHQKPYYFLFLLMIWVYLIYQNYDWQDFVNQSQQWSKMMICMLLLKDTNKCVALLICVGVYHFMTELQKFLWDLPQETEIKTPFKIFTSVNTYLDIQILFDELMLAIFKLIKPPSQKIHLDARAQWSSDLRKNMNRILATAQTLPHGFVLDIRSNHLLDHLSDADYLNRLELLHNFREHLFYEKNGQSDSRDAYLIILLLIKQGRLPASLCIEIFSFLFNREEQQFLVKQSHSKHFSSAHVFQWMKKKQDDLGTNCKSISAISLG